MTSLVLWRLPLHETIFDFVKQKKNEEISVREVSNYVAMTVATNELAETIRKIGTILVRTCYARRSQLAPHINDRSVILAIWMVWIQCIHDWHKRHGQHWASVIWFSSLKNNGQSNRVPLIYYRIVVVGIAVYQWSKMSKQNKLFNTKTNDNAKNRRQWHVMLFTDFQLDQ